jgi:hypothetical protein
MLRTSCRHSVCSYSCMPDSMHFDEHALRLEAKRRVADGRLPRAAPQCLWAGTGSGESCALCDRPIEIQQVEYELEFNTQAALVYRFHRICHQAWELESNSVNASA